MDWVFGSDTCCPGGSGATIGLLPCAETFVQIYERPALRKFFAALPGDLNMAAASFAVMTTDLAGHEEGLSKAGLPDRMHFDQLKPHDTLRGSNEVPRKRRNTRLLRRILKQLLTRLEILFQVRMRQTKPRTGDADERSNIFDG